MWRRVSVTEWGNRLRTWNGLKNYEFGGGQRMWFDYVTSLLPSPLYVELEFHRKTKHRFDYINVAQTILDEMVTHTWIIDDDTQNIKPYFADAQYTPANPGVFIKVLEHKPQH